MIKVTLYAPTGEEIVKKFDADSWVIDGMNVTLYKKSKPVAQSTHFVLLENIEE